MSLARLLWAAAAVAVATLLVAAPSAYACTPPGGGACGGAGVTATLTAGTFALTVPATTTISGTLGSAPSFSQQMGQIEVQDSRGSLVGWTLTAVTTGDLVRSGTPSASISLGTSSTGGPLSITTGTITPVGISSLLNVSAGAGGSLNPSQSVTVARALLGAGGGTYDMTPTLTLTPPANTTSGTYTTTITFTLS